MATKTKLKPVDLEDIDAPPKIKPFRGRLYVRVYPPPEETVTESGLVITQRAREAEIETAIRAEVLAVGPECDSSFQEGDFLLVARFSGTLISHSRLSKRDCTYMIISESSILCHTDRDEALRELGLDK